MRSGRKNPAKFESDSRMRVPQLRKKFTYRCFGLKSPRNYCILFVMLIIIQRNDFYNARIMYMLLVKALLKNSLVPYIGSRKSTFCSFPYLELLETNRYEYFSVHNFYARKTHCHKLIMYKITILVKLNKVWIFAARCSHPSDRVPL